ncbi:hypothetical protein [Microcoleus sp. BROC3]|uniref:hypothetical protein n=1 Tax=Microcoleus sp. BROC3 TaxID=3055323 RepID=UPI002FD01308
MIATDPVAKPGIYFTQAFDAQQVMLKNSRERSAFLPKQHPHLSATLETKNQQ